MPKTRGLIAAGHTATAEAAASIMREGGNAFDAAVAAFLTSFISEPCMNSAGGGAFVVTYTENGSASLYDFFVQTPKHKRPREEIQFFPVEINYGATSDVFHVGMGSAGVPGAIAGIFQMHADLCKLPMRVLAEPAIHLARHGLEVNQFQHYIFRLIEPILAMNKKVSQVFWQDGRLIREGELMFMPDLADCLDYLAREGADAFYKGEIARKLVLLSEARGGHLTAQDLEDYQVHLHPPLRFPYRDRTVITNPLPSLGGSLMALLFAMLEAKGPVDYPPMSRTHVERLTDVYCSTNQIAKTARSLLGSLAQWYPGLHFTTPSPTLKVGGTSHLNILDENGNAAAFSFSIGESCGHFIPNTGILMNNMLGESALLPNGLHSWEEDVRLGSMMSPTILLGKDNHAELVLGSGGSGRIPFMIAQVIHNVVDHGMEIEDAIKAPRLHCEEGLCSLEPGLPSDFQMPSFLRELIFWDKPSFFLGGVHGICCQNHRMRAEGDRRRDGVMLEVF